MGGAGPGDSSPRPLPHTRQCSARLTHTTTKAAAPAQTCLALCNQVEAANTVVGGMRFRLCVQGLGELADVRRLQAIPGHAQLKRFAGVARCEPA